MLRFAQNISAAAMMAALAGAAFVAPTSAVYAQTTTLNLSSINSLGLQATDQASLDAALNAVNAAQQSGDPAALTTALAQLATAVQTAAQNNPNQAATLAGAATALVPTAALTIAQSASAGAPTAAAQIAVSVYTSLPADMQTNTNKSLLASSIATGAGISQTILTTALANQPTTNGPGTVTLNTNAPPPPPPPTSPT